MAQTVVSSSPILILLLLTVAVAVQSATWYVTTGNNSTASCPVGSNDSCFILAHYAQNAAHFFTSDSVLVFLPGDHYLDVEDQHILIYNASNLTLRGSKYASTQSGERFKPQSQIICRKRSGFAFCNVSELQILGLKFLDCGAPIGKRVSLNISLSSLGSFFLTPQVRASLLFLTVDSLTLEAVKVSNGLGYGILSVNTVGHTVISHSTFENSTSTQYYRQHCNFNQNDTPFACQGGNVLFVYTELSRPENSLSIHSTSILYGINRDLPADYTIHTSGGLSCIFSQSSHSVYVNITDTELVGNSGVFGANLVFWSFTYGQVENTLSIRNSELAYGNSMTPMPFDSDSFTDSTLLYYGSAMSFSVYTSVISDTMLLAITDSFIYGNKGQLPAIRVVVQPLQNPDQCSEPMAPIVSIRRCMMDNNHASGVVDLFFSQYILSAAVISDSTFRNNTAKSFQHASVLSVNLINTLIGNSHFIGNHMTAVNAISSILTLSGNVTFIGNESPLDGGAFRLSASPYYTGPTLKLSLPVNVSFIDNHARLKGGAIYSSATGRPPPLTFSQCLFQIEGLTESDDLPTVLYFGNNSAGVAGDAVYGGNLEACNSVLEKTYFDGNDDNTSLITSDPSQVCFCEYGRPQCNVTQYNVTAYRGQSFTVLAVAVGQRNGTTPTVVLAETTGTAVLGDSNELQETGRKCTQLNYSIASQNSFEQITLSPHNGTNTGLLPDISIKVTFLDCPIGFIQSSSKCVCAVTPENSNIACDIDSNNITTTGIWIGIADNDFVFSDNCPPGYCRASGVTVNLQDSYDNETNNSFPEQLCARNHSGQLCGQCRDGYSRIIGSNACRRCSNSYLALIIVFALVGVILVAFIFALNMTVSLGTINSIVFFANVLSINPFLFVEANTSAYFVPMAFINLNLRIETCFYDGFDTFGYVLWQFVFPIYVWLLCLSLVVAAKFSQKITNLIGDNIVPTLATLFLLSYSKLLQITRVAIIPDTIMYANESIKYVWRLDGSLEYGKGKHLFVVIYSVLFLFLVALPFTLLLLFLPCLRRWSHKRMFKWVNKIKPLLDAYAGPYSDSHTYWPGLLLLARASLVLALVTDFELFRLLITIVVVLVLFAFGLATILKGPIYKKWYLNVLELSVLFNLAILCITTAYFTDNNQNKNPLTYTSFTIVYATFILIIALHIYWTVNGWNITRKATTKLRTWLHKQRPESRSITSEFREEVGTTEVAFIELSSSTAYVHYIPEIQDL